VGEATGDSGFRATAASLRISGGRSQQVFLHVVGKGPKHRVWIALRVNGAGQALVKASNGHPHSADGFLGDVRDRSLIGFVFLVGINFFELALHFSFDRFGGVVVFEDGFELFDLPSQWREAVSFVCAEAALDNGVAFETFRNPSGRVLDQRLTGFFGSLPEKLISLEFECQGVDGFGGRVEEEVGDVKCALLVVEDCALAVEVQAPEAEVVADGAARSRGQRAESRGQLRGRGNGERSADGGTFGFRFRCCFHVCFRFGRWRCVTGLREAGVFGFGAREVKKTL